jgi:hypothetical protein
MKWSDIPQLTRDGNYQVHQSWDSLEDWVKRERGELQLNLDPDFQRGHVWSETQQKKYVEFKLRGGKGSDILRLNCVGWMKDFQGPFELVDGKQRLEAVRKFLRDDLKVFGHHYSEFEGVFYWSDYNFIVQVNSLETREKVLQWYLDINTGGVVHTSEEIDKVKSLLENESA